MYEKRSDEDTEWIIRQVQKIFSSYVTPKIKLSNLHSWSKFTVNALLSTRLCIYYRASKVSQFLGDRNQFWQQSQASLVVCQNQVTSPYRSPKLQCLHVTIAAV